MQMQREFNSTQGKQPIRTDRKTKKEQTKLWRQYMEHAKVMGRASNETQKQCETTISKKSPELNPN